ncbi:FAD:protein FMN transferase [Veronia pacifica]|uniref:FAD:protein FMN transferase n=1 Tax=Veronia pacifica TaxID=1080227 RepID=A0A1C3EAG3_9GAMM|nr:FAD:protein FMN transferase [Veronia pacifica]ODA30235.1 FAD:protein FMN transferase ApbE [Veronia pacifica]
MYLLKQLYGGMIFLLVIMVMQGCTQPSQKKVQLEGRTMGTTYHITYLSVDKALTGPVVQEKVDSVLAEVNQTASTYIDHSELSRLNQHKVQTPFPLSDDLTAMFNEAVRLAELTEGALDVTVGPLVNLWGFGPSQKPSHLPSQQQIDEAKARTGIHHLVLNGSAVSKQNADIYVDLSTLAKGYGVDKVAELLDSLKIENYLVEIGGEMRVKGDKGQNGDWRVAVEKPVSQEVAVQRIIVPKDNAVATSGDYRNFFEEDGVRYSHIINPQTGRPVTHRLVSVTVLDPSCMVADGLSTGFMVLGEKAAMRLANQHNIAALFIVKTPEGEFVETYSEAMRSYISS